VSFGDVDLSFLKMAAVGHLEIFKKSIFISRLA